MAYSYTNSKGRTYILHSRDTTLKNGTKQTIYFFASDEKEGALSSVPKGYEVSESKNGLPVLKRASAPPPVVEAAPVEKEAPAPKRKAAKKK